MNYETTAKDGTHIKVKGAGPDMPKVDGPPSNKQIDSSLKTAHSKLEKEKHHLDSHGKTLVQDTQGVMNATSTLVQKKNKEERFQKLYKFTTAAAKDSNQSSEGITNSVRELMGRASGMGSKVSNNASDLPSYIRETILNLTTSTEYRQLVVEFLNLIQSMLGQVQGDIETKKSEIKTADDPHNIKNKDSNQKSTKKKLQNRTDDEQMEIIREKLTLFLKRISKQKEYQTLVRNFFKYSEEIYDTLYETKDSSHHTQESKDLKHLLNEAWEILGDFAGRDLVFRFRKNLDHFMKDVQRDPEVRVWAKESRKLLLDLIDHPDHASKADDQITALIRQGRILGHKYRIDLNILSSDSQKIIYKIRSDPTVKNFQKQLKQLGRDIALNNKGQPDLFVMENSLTQIKNLLVEMFKGVLVDIPIERIDMKNESLDLTLKNISIKGDGLVPELLLVSMTSYTAFHLQKSPDADTKFKLKLRIDKLKPEFKDVKFKYERKSFPSIKDKGVADMIFEDTGLGVAAAITFSVKSGEISKAKLTQCTANVDKITLNIHKDKTKHDTLDSMLAPMIAGRLRTKLQSSIEETIQNRLNQFISQMNDWFETKPFKSMMVKGNEGLHDAHSKKQVASEKKEEKKKEFDSKKKEASAKVSEKKKEMEVEHEKSKQTKATHADSMNLHNQPYTGQHMMDQHSAHQPGVQGGQPTGCPYLNQQMGAQSALPVGQISQPATQQHINERGMGQQGVVHVSGNPSLSTGSHPIDKQAQPGIPHAAQQQEPHW